MAKKPARKSKQSKRAPVTQSGALRLRKLIEDVIDADHRGDPEARGAAVRKLGKFSGPDQLRRHAVDAQAAAGNNEAAERSRILTDLVRRLEVGIAGQ